MKTIDAALRKIIGEIDYDVDALNARYAQERDARLRPDRNNQFIEISAEFGHYADDPYVERIERAPLFDTVDVAVIGGGFSGILAGAKLRHAGIETIRIIEKGGDFGGAWYWNRYPGIRCDSEAYIYLPMIEEVGKIPTEKYTRGSEIYEHGLAIARRYDLYRDSCLQTVVTKLEWDATDTLWRISTDRGDEMCARFVIMGNGLLSKPKLPGIPGIEKFKGHTFHSSRWDFEYTGGDETGELTKLADKNVGLVGTGATSVQIVPFVGEYAKHFCLFQRTAAAVDIRANRPTDPEWAATLQPGWQRERIDNFNNILAGLHQNTDLVDDGFTQFARMVGGPAKWAEPIIGRALTPDEAGLVAMTLDDKKMMELHARIDSIVKDKATAAALKPWYRRVCKRPLFSDTYLPTFNRPNVTLVDTAGRGIDSFDETGAFVAGKHYPLDCVIFATGFEVGTEFTRRAGYEVVGRDGLTLTKHWENGMRTFHGMLMDGFPNLFFMGLGQNANSLAYSFILSEQADHAAYIIAQVKRRNGTTVEPTVKAVDAYVAEILPMSPEGLKFLGECTPSSLTSEGDLSNPHGVMAQLHPKPAGDFYAMLSDWRAQEDLAGLDIR